MRDVCVNGGEIRRVPLPEKAGQGKSKSYIDYKQVAGITDDLSDVEKFERLSTLAEMFGNCATRILDNCTPEKLHERLKDRTVPVTEEDMQRIACEAERAVGLVRACVEDMAAIPLSQMNGTSIAFQIRLATLNAQEAILAQSRGVIEAAREARGLEPSFVCKLAAMAFMSFASFLSEVVVV